MTLELLDRRTLFTGTTGLAALTFLAACGSTDDDAGAVGGTTVDTVMGPVEVPAAPKTIVCLEQYSTFSMLDLGVTPAATVEGVGPYPYKDYVDDYANLPKVGTWEGDIEAIAAAGPDLIFGLQAFHEKIYTDLSGLAPTVLHESNMAGTIPWKPVSGVVAGIIGKQAEQDALVADYDGRVGRVKTDHADAIKDTRISLVNGTEGKWNINYAGSWAGVVFNDLGVTWGEASAGKPGNIEEFSYEQLDMLADSDVIFHMADGFGKPDAGTEALLGQGAFKALPAVKAGNVFPLTDYYVLHYKMALSVVDQLEARYAAIAG